MVLISCGNMGKGERSQQSKEGRHETEVIQKDESLKPIQNNNDIVVGANRTEIYLSLLKGKRVGVVANQTSVIFKETKSASRASVPKKDEYTHLVDSLLSVNVSVKKVFAPEHGFRGTADAGEIVKDGIDTKSNLPIVSLYGKNKKPTFEQLKNLDIVVFDIQDVGARFYTYISSLHYVMEACAEANIPVLILDRPNPNGHYIDGPILEMVHNSFVGMHPIPVVHGMTIGEYAQMINGEKWLKNGIQCKLEIITSENYKHDSKYSIPIKPSPNLPNDQSINLYPSLCFFEGTNVNAGRGTDKQFQVYGSPYLNSQVYEFSYTPKSNEGAKYPKHQDKLCYGENLTNTKSLDELNLNWLINAYKNTKIKADFFNDFFSKLAGTTKLRQQIEQGLTDKEIRETWEEGLEEFNEVRARYLLYD